MQGPFQYARCAGVLPVAVADALRISARTRIVWIHQSVEAHIRERRGDDASFVLGNLHHAIEHPNLLGREQSDPRRILLVRFMRPD